MENSVKEEGGEELERDRMDHPSWIKLAAGRMLVKPWNYHFFEARALDAFSNLPSSSRHVPMFPLFYPLSKEAPTFSSSRDETKFIFLLPLLTNRIREKIPERGGYIFENIITNIFETFKDLQERLQLRLGFGRINPSPSREPDIWGRGGGNRRVTIRSRSWDRRKIGGEGWWKVDGGLLNVTSTSLPFFLSTLLRS